MKNDKITLVTGANGFIGRNLCQTLQARGVRVRALLRRELEGPWDDTVIADLVTDTLPLKYFDNVETIFHLAGKAHAVNEVDNSLDEYHVINVGGTQKLLKAAEKADVKNFIFCSSIKAMGEGSIIPQKESDPTVPVTYYGKSKLAAEQLVLETSSIPHRSAFRPAMVYGPNNPGNLDRMIKAISKGFFPPWPKLQNKRSMVHVDDVIAAAMLLQREDRANCQVYNVTDGEYYSTSEIVDWIRADFGYSQQKIGIPIFILKLAAKFGDILSFLIRRKLPLTTDNLKKLIGSSAFDSNKIQDELGFKAKWNLKDTLSQLTENYKP